MKEGEYKVYKDGTYKFEKGHLRKLKPEELIEQAISIAETEVETKKIFTNKRISEAKLNTLKNHIETFSQIHFPLIQGHKISDIRKAELTKIMEETRGKIKKIVKEYGFTSVVSSLKIKFGIVSDSLKNIIEG
jgi:hypothetical protein